MAPLCCPSNILGRSMITREDRLELFKFFARQRDCSLCKDWPRAEKTARRSKVIQFPKGICVRCWSSFWDGICVVTKDQEEYEALREAAHEERRKAPALRRTGQELLREIRSKRRSISGGVCKKKSGS